MNQTTDGLVEQCTQAARQGAAFPASQPVRTLEDELSHLDVRLRNGYWLRYCARSNDFSLRRASRHRSF